MERAGVEWDWGRFEIYLVGGERTRIRDKEKLPGDKTMALKQ